MVCEGLAGYPPPTQLAVCQLRHRQDLSLSALCALACVYTASVLQIALSNRAVFSYRQNNPLLDFFLFGNLIGPFEKGTLAF
jgi:hypothetical protein